jgi:hypothetical protein
LRAGYKKELKRIAGAQIIDASKDVHVVQVNFLKKIDALLR